VLPFSLNSNIVHLMFLCLLHQGTEPKDSGCIAAIRLIVRPVS
jgi:hypothetical protein